MAKDNAKVTGSTPSRSALSVLFSVVFLDNLGYAIVLPYLFFYAQALGASAFVYGAILASYSLMSFTFTPIVSRLSDRFGRRKILLAALAVSSLSYFIFGIAQVLWLLFAARMLAGSTAATVPVAQAYVADVTDKKNRLRYLGLLGAAAGIAFILGPAIGGILSGLFGFGVPSFLASTLAFVNLVSTYLFLSETPCNSNNTVSRSSSALETLLVLLRKKEMALLLSIYFLFFLAFIFLPTIFPLWLSYNFGYGPIETGILFFYVGMISALTQAFLLPRISKKISNSTLIIYGLALSSTGFLALGVYPNLVLLLIIGSLVPIGSGIIIATTTTLISLNAPSETQGGSLGVAWSVAAVAQTISPTIAASLFSFGVSWGFAGLAFAASAAITLSIFPFVWIFKRISKE